MRIHFCMNERRPILDGRHTCRTADVNGCPQSGSCAHVSRRAADGVPARFWKGLKPYGRLPHHQPIVEANHSGSHRLDVVFGERDPLFAAEQLEQDLDSLSRLHISEDRQVPGKRTA